jgi:nucleotide-binding universal stress UspA family protein
VTPRLISRQPWQSEATLAEQSRRPIVVGVDGTPGSHRALRWAVQEAQLRRVPARIVTATTYPPFSPLSAETHIGRVPALIRPPQEDHDRALAYASSRLPSGMVSGAHMSGDATAHLLDEARQAELVVVGARGRSTLTAAVLGSVSSAVAARAACPVIVVGTPAAEPEQQAHVVVGVDGSVHAEQALGFAFEEASLRGVPVSVVHCWQAKGTDDALAAAVQAESVSLFAHLPGMSDSLAAHRASYPDLLVEVSLLEGEASSVLADQSHHAQLVVVGSRGLGAVTGPLLGSVSQHLLHHAHCPVAVVRARG